MMKPDQEVLVSVSGPEAEAAEGQLAIVDITAGVDMGGVTSSRAEEKQRQRPSDTFQSQPSYEANVMELKPAAVEDDAAVAIIVSKSVSDVVERVASTEEKRASPLLQESTAEGVRHEGKSRHIVDSTLVDMNNNNPPLIEVSLEITALPLKETAVEQHESIISLNGRDQLCIEDIKDMSSPSDAAIKNTEGIVTSPSKVDIKNIDGKCDISMANTTDDLSSSQTCGSVVACELSSEPSSSNATDIGKNEEIVGDVASSLPDESVTECITPSEMPSSPKATISMEEETTSDIAKNEEIVRDVTSSLPDEPVTECITPSEMPSSPKTTISIKEETSLPLSQDSATAVVGVPMPEANLKSVKTEEISPQVDSELKIISSEILQDWSSDSTLQNPSPRSTRQEIDESMEFEISKCASSFHPDDKSNTIHSMQSSDEQMNNNNNAINDSEKIEGAQKCGLYELFEGPIGYEDSEDLEDNQCSTAIVYGCSVCFTMVGCTKESFIRHQKEYHWISLQCKVCKRKFTTTKGYENHMTSHIRYPCLHCPKEFGHQLEVEDHQGTHFPNKLFRCDRCGKEFYLRATLKQHRLFMGEKCPEIQSNVDKIQEQLSSTQNEELVKCRSGCKNLIPKSMMKEHIKHHADKNQDHRETRKRAKRIRLESDV